MVGRSVPEEEELESSLVGGSELDKEEGLTQACPDGEGSGLPNILSLQATKKEVEQWQHEDQTLVRVRELAHPEGAGHEGIERVYFYRREGLVYHHWHPKRKEEDDVRATEQLVLPTQCRPLVLRLAHDVPMAGHLGVTKTKDRILQHYYWPGIFGDVTKYCRTCEVCQQSRGKRPARAPMLPMPLGQKPFTQISMDLIGPLPKTKKRNHFILTISATMLPSTLRPFRCQALKLTGLQRS